MQIMQNYIEPLFIFILFASCMMHRCKDEFKSAKYGRCFYKVNDEPAIVDC